MTAPLALTAGDPSGIGPEITLAAAEALGGDLPFLVIGDGDHYATLGRAAGVPVRVIDRPEDAPGTGLAVLHEPVAEAPEPGKVQPVNASYTLRSIDRAVALAQEGRAAAVVTNPITKKILVDGAGFAHPGHTEYLAALTGAPRPVMMLAAPELRVVPVTIHIALANVPGALTSEVIAETARITHAALKSDFGLAAPRLAVAGLNPHAGEGGMMGREDMEVIAPVIEALRAEGLAVTGPHPGDTLFHAEARARYDAALCMYHDQALIPLKTLNFAEGVNVTLGLPIIRTSPDHGTAYDIAGKGVADPRSLIAAVRMAAKMAAHRTRAGG